MKCVPGKSYKTRSGEKATVKFRLPEPHLNTGALCGYVGDDTKGYKIYNWNDDGKAGMGSVFTNPMDLVEEWAD